MYWQVAAGSEGRDYSGDFLRFGLAFVGDDKIELTLSTVEVGDRIILKGGRRQIRAVGTVVQRGGSHFGKDDKPWLRDYDGWDLGAYCFVDWHEPPSPITVQGLTRATIQRVWDPSLIQEAERVIANYPTRMHLDAEPNPTSEVKDESIIGHLIESGFKILLAEELVQAFRRIRRLANYYYNRCDWASVGEHETRTFLIVPLLQALGWMEQQMKVELSVEGGRVDLALFKRPYTGWADHNAECTAIIESKGFSQGLSYAPDQVKKYAKHFPNCEVLAVSNGYCYKTYQRREDGSFALSPSAYLNILTPRDRYPLDPSVPGCLPALDMLLKGL